MTSGYDVYSDIKKGMGKMRLIMSGGGTGGHINPAIAIADAVKRIRPSTDIIFVGTERGLESRLVPDAGYPIRYIDVEGIKRSLSLSNVRALYKAAKATSQVRALIEEFRPDGAVGTGGYVCFPVMRAASSAGIYTALHESNAIPGLAVKALKKRTDRIFVNFEECASALELPDKVIRTGNPMRAGLSSERREEFRDRLGVTGSYRYLIISFGGSLGAKAINNAALCLMKELTSKRPDILHVHACGKQGYADFLSEMHESGLDKVKNIRVSEYIYDMPLWLTASDLVISRCGAMTLSEIAEAGRASILVPSPNVVDDHQYKNARAFADGGAAYVVREEENIGERITELTATILSDRTVRGKMEENAKKFSFPDANRVIAEEIVKGIGEKSRS